MRATCPSIKLRGMSLTTEYNYTSFSFALEQTELDRWLRDAPHAGELAPDFELEDLNRIPRRLSDLRSAPVVLEFGSYTCPIFSDRIPEMERLALEHPEAQFLVIAVLEAHPGENAAQHTTIAQKRQAARRLTTEEGIRRRVLIDDLQGTVHRAYGGAWDPVYVIDAGGRIVFRRAWNHPKEVAQTLDALANGLEPPTGESIEMAQLPSRTPTGLRLLERGGKQALLDFYRTAPPRIKTRLRESPAPAVRAITEQEEP